MDRLAGLKKAILVLLLAVFPFMSRAVEWRLSIHGAYGQTLLKADENVSSDSWQALENDFVFLTLMESNTTWFSKPELVSIALGIEAWLTPRWGISLQGGYAPAYQDVDHQYNLDFQWFDGEEGFRYRILNAKAELERIFFDLQLHYRLLMGYRMAALFSAGFGLHHFSGMVQHEYGYADTAWGEQYYFDYFVLPLQAELSRTQLVGQLGITWEYRITRTLVGRVGMAWWTAGKSHIPFVLDDQGEQYLGREGHLLLLDAKGLLGEEKLQTYTLDPSALRFTIGLSLWL